ncbi:MAG: histidine kinase, partial [Imperialibacter sp.]
KAERERAELKSASLEAALKLKEAELQLLKGQIHPHFLFNTLNNLYGLALEKSDVLPVSILRLSELLDFLLYRSNKPLVPLADEIKLMRDYIALEELRFEERLRLELDIQANGNECSIAPFLLFPFVENAFKHGFMQDDQQLFLSISIHTKGERLYLTVANSFSKNEKEAGQLGGVGLSNVRKRLELLYPGSHELRIGNNEQHFIVNLELDLKTKDDVGSDS